MVEPNKNDSEDASFNQAGFQQERLNTLFARIDLFSTAPLLKTPSGIYNYQIIFRDLVSCYSTISAKLNDKEKEKIKEKRIKITNYLISNPIHTQRHDWRGKLGNYNCPGNWIGLNELLLDYRDFLEVLMEKYGFGNPSKETEGGWD